jgi:hypothetical protein
MSKERFQLELFDLPLKGRSGDITAIMRPFMDKKGEETGLYQLFVPGTSCRIISCKPEENIPLTQKEKCALREISKNPDEYERLYAVDPMDGPFIAAPCLVSKKYDVSEGNYRNTFIKAILITKKGVTPNEIILETEKINSDK